VDADAIRERVSENMRSQGLAIVDLRVQPDPFDGWRLWLVSDAFQGMPPKERRALVLAGLEGEHFEWLDILTSEEMSWAGKAPLDSDLEDLPLWPEALRRAHTLTAPIDGLFASDLDEDLEPPLTGTFYSLKGGVGRTTALAYTASILAGQGIKVVCVDMDLEAPGLTAVFGREHEIGEDMGTLHILDALDRGAPVDLRSHLIRVDEGLELYLVPAGLPGANYARLLRFADPLAWYREEENPLRRMLDLLRTLSLGPQVILVDARTGFHALNAPFLFELSDLAVIIFFPHPQVRLGTGELVRALLASTTRREAQGRMLTPMPRFLVSPIPASKAPEVVKRYRHRALEWVTEWLSVLNRREHLVEDELTHFVPYRETIATSDSVLGDPEAGADYRPIAEWLLGFLRQPQELELAAEPAEQKLEVLNSLSFQGDTAEHQQALLETFVETPVVDKALKPDVPLVLGRKGTGKTAAFRRLVERPDQFTVVVLAPTPLRGQRPWVLGADGFKQAEALLHSLNTDWREFWSLCIAIALHTEARAAGHGPPAPDPRLAAVVGLSPSTELQFVDTIEAVLSKPGTGLLVADWLDRLDRAVPAPTLLLFDGLDTGFGNTDADRTRRRAAIEGLFSFLTDRGEQLRHIRLKIVLREDLWRSLRFENKSHLFGRSISLKWNDQVDFLRVVLKQALRSKELVRFLAHRLESIQSLRTCSRSLSQSDFDPEEK